jgi:hypothetical protein
MIIVHIILWNQQFDRFNIGDTHLLDMLYSNWYNKYTCTKNHQAFLQEPGLLTSLDNQLA